jgi:hypothetical protein
MPSDQQSSVSPPSLVWFLLLDSATGQPFKGATASSVLRSSLVVPVVDQFRDAVKAKLADSHLKGVAPLDLKVYKNKAAFDKRNAAVDDGKEEPLEEDSPIDGLGSSKKEALVVVVPSSILPSQTQPSSFPLCHVPFYNSICNATERDGWISFGQNIPSTTLKNLYIRESYRTIASSINPGINKAIITGTPGIDKALFLIYLLWKLVKEGKRILFIYHPFNIYYDAKGGVFQFFSGHLPLDADYSFWNDTLWCLFDAKGKKDAHLDEFPYELCTFVVSNSPRREMVNDFKKPPVPQVFYMPTWTEAELEAIAPLFPNANEWRDRFEIPRHVLEVTTQPPTEMLEAACTVSNNYIIVRHKGNEAKRRMSELLAFCQGNPVIAALCGYIFEPYAIELLEEGGAFKCRELVHGSKRIKPDETTLDIPSSIKTVVDKVVPNQTRNRLHVPKTTKYAAIDAWIPGIK